MCSSFFIKNDQIYYNFFVILVYEVFGTFEGGVTAWQQNIQFRMRLLIMNVM
ncbi:hypothetical protein GCM10025885_00750 [Tetragenococcus osmophilus]|uniref:Uncharacterized protein n=1 Tax=Tetragenococcus osmophilus TaxID=526944 RepID=A0AA37XJC0_9ENTE|nr:hypothetical protein GCM10025885_00750 [Tetragenococcus osmophilus]